MRIQYRFLALVVLLGLGIVSCSKEYSVDPDMSKVDSLSLTTDSSWAFTLSRDGNDTAISGIFDDREAGTNSSLGLSVYEFNGDAQGGTDYFNLDLAFKIPSDLSQLPLTISTTDASSYMNIAISDKDNNTYLAATGQSGSNGKIVIAQYDASTKTIVGTFSGTLINLVSTSTSTTCVVSNGVFKVKLP
ncbi:MULTISPECIES: hypothetical protein [Chitinophagaceae]